MTSPLVTRFGYAKDCRAIFETVREYHERFGDLPDFASEAFHAIVARGSSGGLQYLKQLVSDFKCDVNSLSKCLIYKATLEVEVFETPLHTALRKWLWESRREFIRCLTNELLCDTAIANSEGELPLHIALRRGCSLDIIQMVWPRCGNVDVRNQSGDTPLHLACSYKYMYRLYSYSHCTFTSEDKVILHLLNELHCDVNLANSRNELPLHIAIRELNLSFDILVLLVSHFNKDIQTVGGDTPLHLACAASNKTFLRYLISEMHCNVDIANGKKTLPLHIAIRKGMSFDTLVLLVSQFNKDIQTVGGDTPLHLACAACNKTFLRYLISEMHCNVDIANRKKTLPLHIAIRNGMSFDIIVLLVSQLNKDIQTVGGDTPLHLACVEQKEAVVNYLINEMHCNVGIANDKKELPVHIAVRSALSVDIIKLVAPLFHVDAQTCDGTTPLHLACGKTMILNVRCLITTLHCDVNLTNSRNELPLHIAIRKGLSFDILVLLVSHFNKDIQTVGGDTPLHLACAGVGEGFVRYLIKKMHCDVNIPNGQKELPLHIAIRKGMSFDILVLLVSQLNKDIQKANGDTPLHLACVARKEAVVNYLINKMHCNVNIANDKGELPLHNFLKSGTNLNILKLLCPSSKVNSQDSDGNTPLHITIIYPPLPFEYRWRVATEQGLLPTEQRLLPTEDQVLYLVNEIHCDINLTNSRNELPLHIAIRKGMSFDILVLLVSQRNKNAQTLRGDTPLLLACVQKQEKFVCYLIKEMHCEVSIGNDRNDSPLNVAIKSGLSFDVIDLFSSHANARLKNGNTLLHLAREEEIVTYLINMMHCDVTITNNKGELPLHILLHFISSLDILKLLCPSSSEINTQDNDGNTPLHIACNRIGHKDVVVCLINEMHCDINLTNSRNELPLHFAITEYPSFDVLVLLVSQLNKDVQTIDGNTPLHLACAARKEKLVCYLISEMHCNVGIANRNKELPLHIAVRSSLSVDIIKLVAQFCNVNAQTCDGNTPLHLACEKNNFLVVKHLINELHCDATITNDKGKLPLHIFLLFGSNLDILKLLCPHSSNINAQDNDDNTPLHIACSRRGHADLVVYLINDMHCDTTIPNYNGELPLHIAVASKASRLTVVQLASYCPVISAETSCFPMQLADDPVTAKLLEYVQNGPQMEPSMKQWKLIEYLLEKKFYTEYSFLDTAYKQGHYDLVRSVILHGGLNINLYARDSSGKLAVSNHGDTLLHLACAKGDLELFTFLFGMKQIVKDIRNDEGKLPLHCAAASNEHSLEMVKVLDDSHVNQHTVEALHIACHCRNLDVADYLMVERQCSVFLSGQSELTGAILEEMYGYGSDWDVSSTVRTGDTLLHLCCRMNCQELSTYLVVEKQFNPSVVNTFKELPFHIACRVLNLELVKLVSNCNPNALTWKGNTPLHEVSQVSSRSPAEAKDIVQYLIQVKQCVTTSRNHEGKTALHLACVYGTQEVVELLLSIGKADPNSTDHKNQTPLSLTPLDKRDTISILLQHGADPKPLYSMFGVYLKDRNSEHPPESPLRIVVVGNSSAGKTTLIHSLKCEPGCQQEEPEPHTAGIVPTDFNSGVYGSVTWYDFAGEPEYYASHEAILQHIMSASPPVVLLLVDVSKSEEDIEQEVLYWLTFIEHQCQLKGDQPHLVIVGSHADIAEQRNENPQSKMKDVLKRIARNLYQSKMKFIESFVINCCSLTSSQSSALQRLLKTSAESLGNSVALSFLCHCLYVFLLDKFKSYTAIAIDEVMQNIIEPTQDDTIVESDTDAESIESEEESVYDSDSDDSTSSDTDPLHLLPTTSSELNLLCEELDKRGHVIFLRNPATGKGWLVLNKESLLSKVHGSIFAPKRVRSSKSRCLSSSTGVVSFEKFKEHFPEHDPNMLIRFLSHLEFCTEVEDSEVLHLLQQESTNSSDKYFFFPGLIEIVKPEEVWSKDDQTLYWHSTSWVLECSETVDFFTPRFVQLLLLRLAFTFVFLLPKHRQKKGCEIPSIKRQCSVWKNGLSWLNSDGIETVVVMAEQSQAVHVMMRSQCEMPQAFARLRSAVIKKVVETAKDLNNFETTESFIDPKAMKYPCANSSLYRVDEIARAVIQKPLFVRSDGHKQLKLTEVLYFEPYAELNTEIVRELLCRANTEATVSADFLEKLSISVKGCSEANKALICQIFGCKKASQLKSMLRERKWTYNQLTEELDRHSIFCGRNVMVRYGIY